MLLSDPARRARFEQEARSVAALNHPHIFTIHEIESAEGIDFSVMELVPGKTLDAQASQEVWRVSATGQGEEQVTRQGGCAPFKSPDSRTLFYLRACENAALIARPTGGGNERTIAPCVDLSNYSVAPQGVFHLECGPPGVPNASQKVLRYWDAGTGQDRPVATLEGGWVAGVSASPDGRTVLWGRSTLASDLMMIENFR